MNDVTNDKANKHLPVSRSRFVSHFSLHTSFLLKYLMRIFQLRSFRGPDPLKKNDDAIVGSQRSCVRLKNFFKILAFIELHNKSGTLCVVGLYRSNNSIFLFGLC